MGVRWLLMRLRGLLWVSLRLTGARPTWNGGGS